MWLIFVAGFAIGSLFLVDENAHPEKYPETTQINHQVDTEDYSIHLDASGSDDQ